MAKKRMLPGDALRYRKHGYGSRSDLAKRIAVKMPTTKRIPAGK